MSRLGFARGGWDRMGRSGTGRAFQRGVSETFGWIWEDVAPGEASHGMMNKGFLGLEGKGVRSLLKSRGGPGLLKGAGKVGGGLFTAGYMLYETMQGLRQGGIGGALRAGGKVIKQNVIWDVGMHLASKAGVGALAVGGAAVYGYYQFASAGREYAEGLRNMEMGSPIVDPFGTAATMRQRSLNALQNTHINGRMALGNEAILMHEGAYRR